MEHSNFYGYSFNGQPVYLSYEDSSSPAMPANHAGNSRYQHDQVIPHQGFPYSTAVHKTPNQQQGSHMMHHQHLSNLSQDPPRMVPPRIGHSSRSQRHNDYLTQQAGNQTQDTPVRQSYQRQSPLQSVHSDDYVNMNNQHSLRRFDPNSTIDDIALPDAGTEPPHTPTEPRPDYYNTGMPMNFGTTYHRALEPRPAHWYTEQVVRRDEHAGQQSRFYQDVKSAELMAERGEIRREAVHEEGDEAQHDQQSSGRRNKIEARAPTVSGLDADRVRKAERAHQALMELTLGAALARYDPRLSYAAWQRSSNGRCITAPSTPEVVSRTSMNTPTPGPHLATTASGDPESHQLSLILAAQPRQFVTKTPWE